MLEDLRHAARGLSKKPGFATVAVLTLALGIGANTMIFGYVSHVLLTPLPLRAPDRAIAVLSSNPSFRLGRGPSSAPDVSDWRDRVQSVQLAAMQPDGFTLTDDARVRRVSAYRVTANYVDVLGLQPLMGRTFLPEDERGGGARVAVLSHRFWRRHFETNPKVLDGRLLLDGEPFTIAGILPPEFDFPGVPDLLVPLALDDGRPVTERATPRTVVPAAPAAKLDRGKRELFVFGRLQDGATQVQAQSELSAVAAQLEREHPATNRGWGVDVISAAEFFRPAGEILAWGVLCAAVFVVLLIACANVANLLLVRAASRQTELAIRAALGGSRGRIARLLFAESLLLSVVGSALGVLLAVWGLQLLGAMWPPAVAWDFYREITVDRAALGFTALLTIFTAIVAGLLPALRASGSRPLTWLHAGTIRAGISPARARMSRLLVVSEVALALVLLVVAGLFTRAFINLGAIPMGFQTDGVLTMRISLPSDADSEKRSASAAFADILSRIRALPGVEAAGGTSRLPLAGSAFNPRRTLVIEGRRAVPESELPWALDLTVTTGCFHALNIPLKDGRFVDERDTAASPRVAVVSETMARRYWPGGSAVGRRVRWAGQPDAPWITVVGVVGDVRNDDLGQPPLPQIYLPNTQASAPAMSLAIRTTVDPLTLAVATREQIRSVDRSFVARDIRTMQHLVAEDRGGDPGFVTVLGIFSGLALLLAAVGVYGVVASAVSQQTREIGVRMALGANVASIWRLVLRQGLTPVALGLVIGLAAALTATRTIASFLSEANVSPTDPLTIGAVVATLALAAVLASLVPARRATKVDPVVALRAE
jgi:putative ABC transport system permease protein